MYLESKIPKSAFKKVNSGQKAKTKVPMIFLEVKMQQDRCRYKLNCKTEQ